MTPFRKRKSERTTDEKARREARRKELSEQLRSELRDDSSSQAGEAESVDDAASEERAQAAEERSPQSKSQPRSKPKPKPKLQPQSKPTAKSKPTARSKPKAKAEAEGRGRSASKSRRPSAPRSHGGGEQSSEAGAKAGAKRLTSAERRRALTKQLGAGRDASARALGATGRRAQALAPTAKRALLMAGAVLAFLTAVAFRGMGLIEQFLTYTLGTARHGTVWVVGRLDRLLTPARVVAGLTIACAACAIVAQYVDYRGVQVGQPQYADVALIAPPPEVDVHQAVDNHSITVLGRQISVLVPIALAAAALALGALLTRRRPLALLISLAGLAGLAITLLVDLPKGLDEGAAGLSFSGAHAKLAQGFYAELAASAGLVLCGLLLSLHLRPAGERPGREEKAAKSKGARRGSSRRSPTLAKGSAPLAKES